MYAKITEEQIEQIKNHISGHWYRRCPACQKGRVIEVSHFVEMREEDDNIIGSITCKTCHLVSYLEVEGIEVNGIKVFNREEMIKPTEPEETVPEKKEKK